jgi:hypothetical protein
MPEHGMGGREDAAGRDAQDGGVNGRLAKSVSAPSAVRASC